MLWDGHKDDKEVKTSKVDRGYTDYSEEYVLSEAEKVNYEFWEIARKTLIFKGNHSQKTPQFAPHSPKRQDLGQLNVRKSNIFTIKNKYFKQSSVQNVHMSNTYKIAILS